MKISSKALRLYAVTDRSWLKENQTLTDSVEKAILGGVTIVQLREKNTDFEETAFPCSGTENGLQKI